MPLISYLLILLFFSYSVYSKGFGMAKPQNIPVKNPPKCP